LALQEKENEERFRLMIKNSNDVFLLVNEKGEPFFVSNAVQNITGYSVEEITEFGTSLIDPRDLVSIKQATGKVLADKTKVVHIQYRHKHKKNDFVWFEAVLQNYLDHPNINAIVVNARDITSNKGTEQALRKRELEFSMLIENSPDMIARFDTGFRYLYCNSKIIQQFGQTLSEYLGKTPVEINDSESSEFKIESLKKAKEYRKEIEVEQFIKTLDNQKCYQTRIVPEFNETGEIESLLAITRDVTEHKEDELKLKASEEKYRTLIESINVGIFNSTLEGKFIHGNTSVLNMLGHESLQEFLNTPAIALYADPFDRSKIIQILTENGSFKNLEMRAVKKNGEISWISMSAILLKDINGKPISILGSLVDISEKKQVESSLQENKFRLDLAMKAANMAWWEMDLTTGRVIFEERKAKMLGYPAEKFTYYQDFMALVHPDDMDRSMNAMRGHMYGSLDKYEVEYRILTRAGEYIWFYDNGSIVERDAKGRPLIITGLVINVTERKKTELIIHQQNNELKKLNSDKDRFISILAHDLKSPFNSILGFLQLLTANIRKYDIDKIDKQINLVNHTAQNTYQLLEDILMWASAQSGKLPYEPMQINFSDACSDVVESLKLNANNKNISINHFISKKINIFVDVNMFKTILRNLISNAIKFTNSGGIINVSINQFESSIELTSGNLKMKKLEHANINSQKNEFTEESKVKHSNFQLISVSDNGIGIEPEKLSRLFDISQNITTKGTKNESGTGLGLLLCKEFVEKHGGKIWAESKLGKGSEFKFTIPTYEISNDI
jgi:PAS domain S-box-containing protein